MEEDVEVDTKDVKEVMIEELRGYDGIIVGSPTYYGGPAPQIKDSFDRSVKCHGKLQDKVGGVFSSSANIAGGNETTVMAILQSLLIHGMVVCDDSSDDHYGPISIEKPDSRIADRKYLCAAASCPLCRPLGCRRLGSAPSSLTLADPLDSRRGTWRSIPTATSRRRAAFKSLPQRSLWPGTGCCHPVRSR